MPSLAFVYILRCADGSLYTGYTLNLERRLEQHQRGRGGKYTRTHRPVELVYSELCLTRAEAMRRESAIKRLTRLKKLLLLETEVKPTKRKMPKRKRLGKNLPSG
jgi:putative endonuclease